jgi:AraC family transcriptional regulator
VENDNPGIDRSERIHTSYLGVANAPTLFVRTLRRATLFINRERCESAHHGMTPKYDPEDAFAIYIHLRDYFNGVDLWCDGRAVPVAQYSCGAMIAYPLDRDWRAYMRDPFDCLHLHVPRSSLDEVADEIGVGRVQKLDCPPGANTLDPIVYSLATSLIPALEQPDQATALFIDSVALALNAHLCQRYGGISVRARGNSGGLAPWQEKRAKDLLLSRIDGDVTLVELAAECSLSRSHFARAFKKSVGCPPHQWLRQQRVIRAKALLGSTMLNLAEIALICGFTDQAHMSRVFSRSVAMSPLQYRKLNRKPGFQPH